MGKMSKEKEYKAGKMSTSMQGMVDLLKICTVLLAAVSFWSTAQGMKNYVFSEEWQAYAGSLAIQGILLGLNFYYPSFRQMIRFGWKRIVLFLLTIVVLFCSSWFSYIYIVEYVYGKSWAVESRLLIQSTYRRELYAASDYAEEYSSLLANDLGQQILDLYSQAKELSDEEFSIADTIDWQEERDTYTGESFAARSEMLTVINAMESALQMNSSANEQERAIEIIVEIRNGLEGSCNSISARIDATNENLDVANDNYQLAQKSLNMATEETDMTSMISAVESAQNYLESQYAQLQDLQKQLTDYQVALGRLQFYEINLGLLSDGSASLISASLRNIQQELYQDNPNLDSLETKAISVFDILQSTIDVDAGTEGEKYQELLRQMDLFIRDLRNYSIITDSSEKFNELIEALRVSSEEIVSGDEEWKSEWSGRLDGLKSQIAALPVYSGAGSENLLKYDRAISSDTLDEMIRLYIADHNAAQQGIIYLFSPYWELALFSLILAFFLDIAAFVTGMFVEILENKKEDNLIQAEEGTKESRIFQMVGESEEDFVEFGDSDQMFSGLNRYIYLNGDYIHEAGKNIYRAIEEGKEIEIALLEAGLKEGLYEQHSDGWIPIKECKELSLLAEPQDGIYQNSTIRCRENVLSIIGEDGKENYLATITDSVPAYILEDGYLDIMPMYELKEKEEKVIIVALNQEGTAVVAIYLCDKGLD